MLSSTRRIRSLVVAAVALLWAAGCGDDAQDDSNPTETPSPDSGTSGDVAPADDTTDAMSSDATSDGGTLADTGGSDVVSSEPDGSDTTSTDGGTRDGSSRDGGSQASTYRVLAISEDAMNESSNYFALRFGGDQQPAVLPDGSSKTYSYGTGDIGLAHSGNRLFVLDQRCARNPDPESCSKDSGEIREVSFQSDGSLQTNATLDMARSIYNPQDIGFNASRTRHYATSYLDSSLQVFESNGDRVSSVDYDTSIFDPDGSERDRDPEAADVVVDGKYVLVLLQALDGFSPENNSRIAVLETSSGDWVDFDSGEPGPQPLVLPGQNAFGGLAETPSGNFAVGLTGSFSSTDDSKVVLVQRQGPGQYQTAQRAIVSGSDLGGNITGVEMMSDSSGYATVTKNRSTMVKYFELQADDSVQVEQLSVPNGATGAICLSPDRRRLFVADAKGYLAYDATTRQQVTRQPVAPSEFASSRECVVTTK